MQTMKRVIRVSIEVASLVLIALAVIACVFPATAQTLKSCDAATAQRSQKLLNETVTASGAGAAVLIVCGNKPVLRAARGMANVELNVALSPDQTFRIASITKTFVAALIVKMSESGELSLDDRLSEFVPDIPSAENITVRQLLNHTAGVSDKVPPAAIQPGFSRRDVDTKTHLIEIAKRTADFAPGTDRAYSNSGYILLGAVIEKVTGKPWYEAIDERISKPLGLKNTTYGISEKILKGRVAGYTTVRTESDKRIENASFISASIPAAAGGLVSSVDDLRLFIKALTSEKIVSKAGFAQISSLATLADGRIAPPGNYGLGMYIWKVRGETMIGHTGQINGFASILAYLPARDITVIVLANDYAFDAQNFGRRLAAISLGKPYTDVKSVPIPAADLAALAGDYQDLNFVRTLAVKDGKLYSQRPGRNPYPMQMAAGGTLHFVPDELTYLVPVKDDDGKIIRLDFYDRGDGPPRTLPRLN